MRGYAYDFYCAMDNGGAVTGDLAAVPGFIAALLVVVWVLMKIKLKSCSNLLCCHHYLGRYNSNLGVSVVELLLLWSALNFCKAITVIWGERLADLLRRRIIILVVWVAFVLTFLMLSQVTESSELWLVSFGDWYFSTIPTGLTFGLPALLAIRLRFWVHTSAKYILSEGPDNGLNAGDNISIPASQQLQGENYLEFRQRVPGWIWGITNLLLKELVDGVVLAPDVLDINEYGWRWGDNLH